MKPAVVIEPPAVRADGTAAVVFEPAAVMFLFDLAAVAFLLDRAPVPWECVRDRRGQLQQRRP
jgi:hypothetical protein